MLPAAVGRTVTALLSHRLGVPSALLSRCEGVWRFEAEAWPDAELKGQAPWQDAVAALEAAHATTVADERAAWTGIALGRSTGERTWMLLLPGSSRGLGGYASREPVRIRHRSTVGRRGLTASTAKRGSARCSATTAFVGG